MLTEPLMRETDTVPVVFRLFSDTGPLDLTGAVVTCRIRRGSDEGRPITVVPLAPLTAGRVEWIPDGATQPGDYVAQLRAVRSGVDLVAPTGDPIPFCVGATI